MEGLRSPRASWLVVALAACGPAVATSSDDGSASSSSTGVAETSGSATATTSTTTAPGETTTTAGGSTESGELDGTTDAPKPDLPGCPAPSCGNTSCACTDSQDNDDDGLVDLLDPGCISVCDDDEGAFGAGLPGDNFDCNLDCAFDGNSGQGDDGCIVRLRCDPEDPGAVIGCAYLDPMPHDPVCDGWLDPQSEACIAFCEPFVLPGCDCFGCCTFATEDGPVSLYLESTYLCAPEDLAPCLPCTSRIEECGNVCTPETCEICIGEIAPPDGCATNACDNGEPCTTQDDCACGEMCLLGCCLPLPPG